MKVIIMDNLIYFKPNRWKVKKIGLINSLIRIGLCKNNRSKDFVVSIPNMTYNLVMVYNWEVIHHYEYLKDKYEHSYLIFVNPRNSNQRIKIEINQIV